MTAVYALGAAVVSQSYADWGRNPGSEDGGGGGGQSLEEAGVAEGGGEEGARRQGEGGEVGGQRRRLTPLERLTHQLSHDEPTVREVTLGKRIGFYRLRGQIGAGNFSQVKLAVHSLTREKVAIKILDKTKLDQKTQRLLSREIASMERLHHPNIIRLYEVIETLSRLHLVMEYAGGGELFTRISAEGRLQEDEAKDIFAQIVSAVKHMHEKGTVHRDLKAENIFIALGGRVKVGDFGFSTVCGRNQTLSTFCGSPPYAAPELFRDESYAGAAVDIWALGVLLYFMVAGSMPFRADTVAKLKRSILEGVYPEPPHLSAPCGRLIRSLLRAAASERCSLQQLVHSEWMRGAHCCRPLDPFPLDPGHLAGGCQGLRREQEETRGALTGLGVTEAHMLESLGKGPRSPVTGLYRIVLHRAQRRQCPDLLPLPARPSLQRRDSTKIRARLRGQVSHTSKLCSIL
ncbi:LOW QUALITY PROTEIN: serine/threonine-protein kinase NIM1-like [Leucoraja erinacea]|uniref:LOW QUALITY PROTEIN: serine/threonine-protein kinase NIM1-like n=1 Tax=Leucoraja erinaceus TaxID=7782 RepID=UPI0024562892|nr:LOW QUALITY PROTEIN: serine/threonine-protein kinase NIM1-like [Leucoraja erinacea]